MVKVKNPPGHGTVTIKGSPRIKPLKEKYEYPVPNTRPYRFPLELKEGGDPASFRVQKKDLATALSNKGYSGYIRFKVEVTDTLDKIYRSKKHKFNIDNWAKQKDVDNL